MVALSPETVPLVPRLAGMRKGIRHLPGELRRQIDIRELRGVQFSQVAADDRVGEVPHLRWRRGHIAQSHLYAIGFALESVQDCPQPAYIGTQRQDGQR